MNEAITFDYVKPIGTGRPAREVTVTIAGTKHVSDVRQLLGLMRSMMDRVADDENMPENWEENLITLLDGLGRALQVAPPIKEGDFVRRVASDAWYRVTDVHHAVAQLPDVVTEGDSEPRCVTEFAEHYPIH